MEIIIRPSFNDIFPNQSSTIDGVLKKSNAEILFDLISKVIFEFDKNFDTEKKQFSFLFNLLLKQSDKKTIEKVKERIIFLKRNGAEIRIFNKITWDHINIGVVNYQKLIFVLWK